MLPKERRIRNSRDYKRVYQRGSFFADGFFSINFLPNRLSFSRLGIVVNRKIDLRATVRNKIKRRFREASKNIYNLLPKGYDIVITIKKPAKEIDFIQIETSLKDALKKIQPKK